MSPYPIVVRFSETIISDGYSDDELRSIAQFLVDNPGCGTRSKDIEHLYWVKWPNQNSGDETTRQIWFICFAGLPHIEVIAITTSKDKVTDDRSWKRIGWKILRIYMLIRALIRLGRRLSGDDDADDDHVDDVHGEF